MQAMVINRYGAAIDVMQLKQVAKPSPRTDEVLVRVMATSVNPIDYKMLTGYGSRVFRKKRGFEFPVILGNDVCGIIEAVGAKVTNFQPGDEVFAAPDTSGQGSYCEYRSFKAMYCVKKPINLSFVEAASIPYVALTTWAGLVTRAKLGPQSSRDKKVLVHGGSGGIGSFAIQLLKAWGGHVATTCSTEKLEKVKALGADLVIDYKKQDFSQLISNYDVVLDTVGGDNEQKSIQVLKKDGNAHYVTLVTPVLRAIDDKGFLWGGFLALTELLRKKKACKKLGIHYHWGLFKSDAGALATVKDLIENDKIRPVVDRVFPLDKLTYAHGYAETGKAFGKVSIEVS